MGGPFEARSDGVVGITSDERAVVAGIGVAAFGFILVGGDVFLAEEIDIREAIEHARRLQPAHAVDDSVLQVGEHEANVRFLAQLGCGCQLSPGVASGEGRELRADADVDSRIRFGGGAAVAA